MEQPITMHSSNNHETIEMSMAVTMTISTDISLLILPAYRIRILANWKRFIDYTRAAFLDMNINTLIYQVNFCPQLPSTVPPLLTRVRGYHQREKFWIKDACTGEFQGILDIKFPLIFCPPSNSVTHFTTMKGRTNERVVEIVSKIFALKWCILGVKLTFAVHIGFRGVAAKKTDLKLIKYLS